MSLLHARRLPDLALAAEVELSQVLCVAGAVWGQRQVVEEVGQHRPTSLSFV